MSVITGRRLNRFWQKGIKPLKDLLGSHDIDDLSDDGTVTGALSKLNTEIFSSPLYAMEINSDNFSTTEDYYLDYYRMGKIVVVEFYMTSAKAFNTWSDYDISPDKLPKPHIISGNGSIPAVYLGSCWTQNKTEEHPLIQVTSSGSLQLRTFNASFSTGEIFRGTFIYVADV